MARLPTWPLGCALGLLGAPAPAARAQAAAAEAPAKPPYFGNVSWSPDGRTLLFESTRDGTYAVYAVGADGTRLRRLTPPSSNNEQARWSPDGRTIVFASDRDGHQQLYLMAADGTRPRRLTRTDSTEDFYAAFSPDGRWIAFAVQPRPKWADYAVAVIRPDGSGRRALTDSTRTGEGPQWSADGQRIVFQDGPALARRFGEATPPEVRSRSRAMRWVSVRPDGTALRPEPSPPDVGEGALSPDGRWRAVARTGAGAAGIYLIELATGAERRLAGQ